jgi:8-oxo-dGTP pyrophosphatase MutT (NUDIX family)
VTSRLDPSALRALLAVRPPERVVIAPPLRAAAVALVLAPLDDRRPAMLFIKRAEHPLDPWSGQIALPGGRHDAADPDLLATAVRETEEETGLRLSSSDLVGELDDLSPVSPHLPPLVVRPFVFSIPAVPPLRLSNEVALHLWVPLDALRGHRTHETVHVQARTLDVPGYRVGPHFIWGMTERIITPFLTLERHI